MTLNGHTLAEALYREIGTQLEGKRIIFISFIETPQSKQFIRMKQRAAMLLGVETDVVTHNAATVSDACSYIQQYRDYDGIIVQLPLPAHLVADTQTILDAVPVDQDIDTLSTQGRVHGRIPPVVRAVDTIVRMYSTTEPITLLGKGMLVGAPLYDFYTQQGRVIHAYDHTMPEVVRTEAIQKASILITGMGIPWSITPDMIGDSVLLIDAGTSEQAGVIKGDIHPACAEKARIYTPVPGGIGPLTVASVLYNMLYS